MDAKIVRLVTDSSQERTGYWLQAQSSRELEAGMVLWLQIMCGEAFDQSVGGLSLYSFSMIPARLTG